MTRPWLSVIVPTYNGAAYLPAALESIAAQGDDHIEVLAIDDGSTDAARDILRQYASRLPLQLIERQHAGNWVANVNLGLSLARGEYVSVLHQDDFWLPRRLETLRRLTQQWPTADLVVHPCWYVGSDGRRVGYWHCPLPRRTALLSAAEMVPRLLVQCFIAVPAPMFRAKAARGVGCLDETLWYSADWEFWLRLASLGRTIYCPTPLAAFRVHTASQTWARCDLPSEMSRQQAMVLARHLPEWEASLPDGRTVARVARFSAEVNVELAKFANGGSVAWLSLARHFAGLAPGGWRRYFRDSRIVERCISRLQLRSVRSRCSRHHVTVPAIAEPGRPARRQFDAAGACTTIGEGEAV